MRYSTAILKARIAKLEMELIHRPPISDAIKSETEKEKEKEKVILDLKCDVVLIEQYYNANPLMGEDSVGKT